MDPKNERAGGFLKADQISLGLYFQDYLNLCELLFSRLRYSDQRMARKLSTSSIGGEEHDRKEFRLMAGGVRPGTCVSREDRTDVSRIVVLREI